MLHGSRPDDPATIEAGSTVHLIGRTQSGVGITDIASIRPQTAHESCRSAATSPLLEAPGTLDAVILHSFSLSGIDVQREPMACCFGNLKQLFASGQEFSSPSAAKASISGDTTSRGLRRSRRCGDALPRPGTLGCLRNRGGWPPANNKKVRLSHLGDICVHETRLVRPCQYGSRSVFLSTFPAADSGNVERTSILRGHL